MTLTDTDLAITAAVAGAAVLRSKYGTALQRYEKSSTDFATDADVEAERLIKELLKQQRPADAVIGEESGHDGAAEANRTWLVDPLCGTLNYAAHTPLVAVNVALRDGNRTVAAAVMDPFTPEVFWTDGRHTYVRHGDADEYTDEMLQTSANSRIVDVNIDPPHPNGERFLAARLLTAPTFLDEFRPRVLSTTLALAWVAAGRRAGYVTDGHLDGSVHFAAGIALCEAAGAVVTNLRGEPLHTGVGGLIVAADEQAHAALLSAIDEQFRDRQFGVN